MKAQEGDSVAVGNAIVPLAGTSVDLAELFGEHHRRVLKAAYRITGSMADAEDVAQTVFLRLAGGEAPVTNAGSYLYRAAINGALDLLRRRRTAACEPMDSAAEIASTAFGSSPERESSDRELRGWLRSAISELSPRAGEMFSLRYLEELSNGEIAVLMGTSQAVVAVTLHNARSRLKKRLKELDGSKR